MAQEKNMNEKPKRTRRSKVKDESLPVEQITELMLVQNKNDPKAGVRAVSEIDGQGKVKTVPVDERNENSFLKFDKNSSILENFIKNFWSQLKNPTHFRLIQHFHLAEGFHNLNSSAETPTGRVFAEGLKLMKDFSGYSLQGIINDRIPLKKVI